MPQKHIYVKDEDLKIFDEATKLSNGESLSSIILDSVKLYIASKKQSDMVEIEIKSNGQVKKYVGKYIE